MTGMLNGNRRVLVLAPHTDDAELGCGGTISRLVKDEAEVFVAVWSTCAESLPPGAPSDLLKREFLTSMGRLNVCEQRIRIFDYPVRRLSNYRQQILEELVALRRDINPALVFLPCDGDLHQDHHLLFEEGRRAFKQGGVLGYELPWNQVNFAAQGFVVLDADDVESKWRALSAYNSQIELQRPYFSREFIEGLARVRGVMAQSQYAEAFEVVRVKW